MREGDIIEIASGLEDIVWSGLHDVIIMAIGEEKGQCCSDSDIELIRVELVKLLNK